MRKIKELEARISKLEDELIHTPIFYKLGINPRREEILDEIEKLKKETKEQPSRDDGPKQRYIDAVYRDLLSNKKKAIRELLDEVIDYYELELMIYNDIDSQGIEFKARLNKLLGE